METGADGVAVLIPAFNCAATIGDVVAGARQVVETVLVVSDGSADATVERATDGGAEVVRHDINRGKGAAIETGMRVLAQRGFQYVVTMDGDGQHLSDQ